MKVILTKDLSTLGKTGEIKTVKPGYGRNYLLPKKLAQLATAGVIKNWQLGEKQRLERRAKQLETAKASVKKMAGTVLSFTRTVGENGQLFGSVGKADILKSLKASGLEADKDSIVLTAPIKTVGDTDVTLSLVQGAEAVIKIRIVPKST